MDRPISAARWSTRETERERRENERAGESSPPMAWYAGQREEKRREERGHGRVGLLLIEEHEVALCAASP